jgi:hypothetical protein
MKDIHDRNAPYWAAASVIFGATALSAIWFDLGNFFSGYVLDIMGPAWNYILFRGLFTTKADNRWTRFFTPTRTLLIFVFVCFGIETLQYSGVYNSTFDPWDLLAYVSLLFPLFILDSLQQKKARGEFKRKHRISASMRQKR